MAVFRGAPGRGEHPVQLHAAGGKDADTLDGLNPSCAVIDEVHAHKNRDVWDVIESGTGARENPLLIGITTAGDGSPESIYAELKKRTEDVLSGAIQDDTWFGMIFTLDGERIERGRKIPADSWKDERTWIKANPNLGVSVNIEDLRRLAQKAKESPASVANFRRKRMNEDVGTSSLWLPTDEGSSWQACARGDFYDGHGLTGGSDRPLPRPQVLCGLRPLEPPRPDGHGLRLSRRRQSLDLISSPGARGTTPSAAPATTACPT